VERSSKYEFEFGRGLDQDLIIFKLFALRPRDLEDVRTVVTRQRGRLDWRYIEEQLRPLAELKEEPEIWRKW
jgi:hypothetical protein